MSKDSILLCLSKDDINLILDMAVHAACSMTNQTQDFTKRKNNLEAKLLMILEGAELQWAKKLHLGVVLQGYGYQPTLLKMKDLQC